MDLLEFLVVLAGLVLAGVLMNRYMTMKDNQFRAKLISDSRKRNKEIKMKQQNAPERSSQGDVGDWVPDLLDSLGLDPNVIFEEEMPEDLEQFLPAIKGFLDSSGGIEGVAAKILKPQDEFKGL